MLIEVTPEPLFALDLLRNQIAKKYQPLLLFVEEKVDDPADLAIIDASMLLLVKTLSDRVQKFANIEFLSDDTWRAVIANSHIVDSSLDVNNAWLQADIEEFITEVVSPLVGSGNLEPLIPSLSNERGTPDDEYVIHSFAVVNAGLGFIRGISSTINNYGDTEAIIGRLEEYFNLMELRGKTIDTFIWEDGR